MTAIAARGEAILILENAALMLRPSFAALVAAEEEIGPLFALVERAASGALTLSEMVALFWHCFVDRPEDMTREAFGEAVTKAGLAAATPALKILLGQILSGR
jgi:Phage tail tube protein, GTA-gp10